MIRAIVLALSAAFLLAPTQPTGPAPLVAKPKWVINYADSFCLLQRDRSLTEAGVALRTRPFADNHEFALMLPPSADRPFNPQGKVMVSDMATAVDRWIGMGTSKQAESRVVETSITASELAAAIASARIRIVVPGKFNTAVKLPNMAKAAEALRACEDDLAKRWKIARNWVTDPKLIPDSRGPFRHSDYPQNLVAANRSGSVLVLLAVYSIGRVSDCRIIDRDISIPEIIRPWRIDRFKPILRPSSRGSWRWFCVF